MKGVKNMTRKVLILGAGNAQYDAINIVKKRDLKCMDVATQIQINQFRF